MIYETLRRKVTEILTVLGDIGGLQRLFIGVGLLLVGFVTQKMFMSSILKKIYRIRNYDNIEHEAQKHFKKGNNNKSNAKFYPKEEV